MKDNSLGLIGKKIKEIRKSKGLALHQVAEKSGVTAGLISKIENFRTVPSIPVLHQISQSLGVSMSDLVIDVSNSQEIPVFNVIREEEWVNEERDDSSGMVYKSIIDKVCKSNFVKVNMVSIMPRISRPSVTNDAFEIIHAIDGTVKYSFPKSEVTISKGDTIYFDGRVPHSVENLNKAISRVFVLYLSDEV